MKTKNAKFKNPKDDFADANINIFPKLSKLKLERPLCLDDHILSEFDGDEEIALANMYIQINKKPIIDIKIPFIINAEALNKLYEDTVAMKDKESDILALKILLGVNSGIDDKMHFLYQVLSLSSDPANDVPDVYLQKQAIFTVKEGKIYDYKDNSFTNSISEDYQKNYREKCEIIHRKKEPFKQVDPKTDTLGVIFSFQELFALLHTNGSTELYIFNCTRRILDLQNFSIKHSLVLATTGTTPSFLSKINYANLTHLCPPNCARFLYPIES